MLAKKIGFFFSSVISASIAGLITYLLALLGGDPYIWIGSSGALLICLGMLIFCPILLIVYIFIDSLIEVFIIK